MKLNINGYAQHGKDTVADLFCQHAGLKKLSISHVFAEGIMKETNLGPYDTIEECYQDRVNNRAAWYNWIRSKTIERPNYFVKLALEQGDMFVGHRATYEFEQTRHLFDATIWVDASQRGMPKESITSCDLDCTGHDFIIDNGSSLAVTENQVRMIIRLINNRKVAENAYS